MTINQINYMAYIGRRKCSCPIEEDDYFGSGKFLLNDINRYGKKNFKKVILSECDTDDELYEAEDKFIRLFDAVSNKNFYNCAYGGPPRGDDYVYSKEESEKMEYLKNKENNKILYYCVKLNDSHENSKSLMFALCWRENNEIYFAHSTIFDDSNNSQKLEQINKDRKGNNEIDGIGGASTKRIKLDKNKPVESWILNSGYTIIPKEVYADYLIGTQMVASGGGFKEIRNKIINRSWGEIINKETAKLGKENINYDSVLNSRTDRRNDILDAIAKMASTSEDCRRFMELTKMFPKIKPMSIYNAISGKTSIPKELVLKNKLRCSEKQFISAIKILNYDMRILDIIKHSGRQDHFLAALNFCIARNDVDEEVLLTKLKGKKIKAKSISEFIKVIDKHYNKGAEKITPLIQYYEERN